jgi:hypothetical protein
MTQKQLESDTNTHIAIRGKGAVKGGKMGPPAEGDDDELHVMIHAEDMVGAVKATNRVIEMLQPVADEDNEYKRSQLRKLAEINGTLRDRVFEPMTRTWQSADVYCKHCGEISHPTADCPLKGKTVVNRNVIESDYDSFMKDVGDFGTSKSEADADYESFMASLTGKPPSEGGGGGSTPKLMGGPPSHSHAMASHPSPSQPPHQQQMPPGSPWPQKPPQMGYGNQWGAGYPGGAAMPMGGGAPAPTPGMWGGAAPGMMGAYGYGGAMGQGAMAQGAMGQSARGPPGAAMGQGAMGQGGMGQGAMGQGGMGQGGMGQGGMGQNARGPPGAMGNNPYQNGPPGVNGNNPYQNGPPGAHPWQK